MDDNQRLLTHVLIEVADRYKNGKIDRDKFIDKTESYINYFYTREAENLPISDVRLSLPSEKWMEDTANHHAEFFSRESDKAWFDVARACLKFGMSLALTQVKVK